MSKAIIQTLDWIVGFDRVFILHGTAAMSYVMSRQALMERYRNPRKWQREAGRCSATKAEVF
jgi:hypothetical protein